MLPKRLNIVLIFSVYPTVIGVVSKFTLSFVNKILFCDKDNICPLIYNRKIGRNEDRIAKYAN